MSIARKYIQHAKKDEWIPFNRKLAHRDHSEHIIRNEKDLHRIRKYITDNPIKWDIANDNSLNKNIH